MNTEALPAIAYWYAQKIQLSTDREKTQLNKNFSEIILEKIMEGRAKTIISQLYLDYMYEYEGETSSIKEFKEYLMKREDYEGEGNIDDCPHIRKNEGLPIDNEITQKLELFIKGMNIESVSSLDVSDKMELGIYHVDFGEQRMTMYVDKEDAILFSLKLPEDRKSIKYTLLRKKDLIVALGEKSERLKERLVEADKDKEYWPVLVEILNSFIDKDILTIKEGMPSIAMKTGKAVNADMALANILEIAPPFWKDLITKFEDNPNPQNTKAFAAKMHKLIEEGKLTDNGFVTIKKGGTSLVNVAEYIEALEDQNIELATKLTKGDGDTIGIRIHKILKTKEISSPSKDLTELLLVMYNKKVKYRAEMKMIENMDSSGIYDTASIKP